MNEYHQQDSTIPRTRFRLETGVEVFEEWATTASQHAKNAAHKALFAMVEGTLFRSYRVVDDYQRPNELFVIVKDDLVMKIRINCFDSFGVVHIGPPAESARFRDSAR
ncbi:DUF6235 family protein [Actinophytocola glycyrrhizae]|uniref:DUF6235 family protein n=1 Tax=Actinophytocola glycyrrhizae TaxID=2044873 RepID=A0ABV9S7Q2_9PSEU